MRWASFYWTSLAHNTVSAYALFCFSFAAHCMLRSRSAGLILEVLLSGGTYRHTFGKCYRQSDTWWLQVLQLVLFRDNFKAYKLFCFVITSRLTNWQEIFSFTGNTGQQMYWNDVRSCAFPANGYNEVLSGCQLGRVVEQWTNLCFEDHLCPHPQSCDVTGYPAHHLCTCPSCVCCWPLANGDCWMGLSVRSDRPDHTSLHRKEKKLDIQCLKKLQKKKSRLLSQSGHSILSNSLQWLAGNNKHAAQTGI